MYQRDARQQLVQHVQDLERLEEEKQRAAAALKAAFDVAKADGYDTTTLKVVLKLRKLTPSQRRERRALEAIYMAALGLLDGDPLPDEARRRLSGEDEQTPPADAKSSTRDTKEIAPPPAAPEQPPLIQKDPDEARQEGANAAAAGQRIYDNPYRASDPCRAAWDEGWCGQNKSHGMDVPKAYQRRESPNPPKKDDGAPDRSDERGAA
jgi:uncharacterized protein (UPF0335 family)